MRNHRLTNGNCRGRCSRPRVPFG